MNSQLMTRKWAVIAAGFAIAGGIALRADDTLPKAETILDRYIEVTGGKAAYEKRKTEIATGTFEMAAMGVKGTITHYAAEPDKSYLVIDLEGVGKIEQGSSAGVAWEKNVMTGSRVKDGAEKAETLRDDAFNAELNWRKQFKKVETTGTETVEGEECYKVVMTPAEGNPRTTYYSKKTGLVLKVETVAASPQGEFPVEMINSNYKTFDGILQPTKTVEKAAGQEFSITIESVKVNETIPPEKFEIPADIKALLNKPAAK
jgi:hypothetical protein